MKNYVASVVLLTCMASCSSTQNLPVRNGPQAIHPADWQRVQNGEMQPTTVNSSVPGKQSDACGAAQLQYLVGGPSSATLRLNIAGDSRHYGGQERVATNVPTRLNFVHSGTATDAVIDPSSTVVRVFCG